ncbi:MAG: hypothetical protein B6229_06740 [Spirochaetaceae bacterium 4572_7]|nr:MAG: hypothetical protein B6229_06740 [Spirochaetaceae bacterium 4572_7]
MGNNYSGSIDLSMSENNDINDLSGDGLAVGASGSLPVGPALAGIGQEFTESLTGAKQVSTASLSLGVGSPYEVHTYYTNTKVKTFLDLDLGKAINKTKDFASDLIETVKNKYQKEETNKKCPE